GGGSKPHAVGHRPRAQNATVRDDSTAFCLLHDRCTTSPASHAGAESRDWTTRRNPTAGGRDPGRHSGRPGGRRTRHAGRPSIAGIEALEGRVTPSGLALTLADRTGDVLPIDLSALFAAPVGPPATYTMTR